MGKFFNAALIMLLIGPSPLGSQRLPAPILDQIISAVPVRPDPQASKRIGALEFVEAWELKSNYTRFGGFSAMTLIGPRRFLLLSDTGLITGLTLGTDGTITRPFIAPLPAAPGDPSSKSNADAESMTTTDDRRNFWVGYEHANAIFRFGPSLLNVEAQSKPPLMQRWMRNGGAEAMVRLADGRFVVLAEKNRQSGNLLSGLLFQGDPTTAPSAAIPFVYDTQGKGAPTDIQQLPDGRLLILHRDLSLSEGFITTLALADSNDLAKDRTLQSTAIARIASPDISDNFEGMAVTAEGPDLMLWMVSDDNLNGIQRSLLVKYRIDPAALGPPSPGFTG